MVTFNESGKSCLLLDPMTRIAGLAEKTGDSVRVQLAPERSVFIRCTQSELKAEPFVYFDNSGSPELIEGSWKVEFISGGPVLPASFKTDSLLFWTDKKEPEYLNFAGTARYSVEFEYDGEDSRATLDLGKINDCARIRFNGRDFGTLNGPGYMVNIDHLKKGKNRLEVEVTNVAANRIRDLDQRGVVWRKFYDINLVNIDYKPFDASRWPVRPAGLAGPVVLTSFE